MLHDVPSDRSREEARYGIPDLDCDSDLIATPFECVGECLQPRRFPMGNWSVFRRVEIASLFRFVKFATNGTASRDIPLKSAE